MNTITLNGKIYETADRDYEEVSSKKQTVQLGLSGKTISQNFSVSEPRWLMTILVWLTAPASGWGAKSDLEAAYALSYCGFTDINGTNQGNVYIEGDLSKQLRYALIDSAAPFKVSLSLRKRLT